MSQNGQTNFKNLATKRNQIRELQQNCPESNKTILRP